MNTVALIYEGIVSANRIFKWMFIRLQKGVFTNVNLIILVRSSSCLVSVLIENGSLHVINIEWQPQSLTFFNLIIKYDNLTIGDWRSSSNMCTHWGTQLNVGVFWCCWECVSFTLDPGLKLRLKEVSRNQTWQFSYGHLNPWICYDFWLHKWEPVCQTLKGAYQHDKVFS